MTHTLYFAQVSDIHISSMGDHHDMLSGRSAGFLAHTFAELNEIEDLDFVLITGDLFDTASQEEFDLFQQAIHILQKPSYIIPGNHDRRHLDSTEGLTRHQFARHFNPQFKDRPTTPDAQVSYWSISVSPKIQLIGLDSIRDKDWGGMIDAAQIRWLENELIAHADKLIILAVHHPFHALAPIDHHPDWTNFVCDNGPEMLDLLDRYPQVKIVLTAHHHLTRVDSFGRRLHLACPAMSVYPCAYRTLRLSQQTGDTWSFEWQTQPATDEATIAEAQKRTVENWRELGGFGLDSAMREHTRMMLGNERDRRGEADLK